MKNLFPPLRPVFEKSSYSGEVSESVPLGTSVLVVRAADSSTDGGGGSSDGHEGRMRRMVYSVADSDLALRWFRVHPFSGMVVTSADLDWEVRGKVTLKIKAQQDSGVRSSSNSSSAAFTTVEIVITDVNDVAPAFSNAPGPVVDVTVSEAAPVGTAVYVASATDPDEGAAGVVAYRLEDDAGGHFRIDNSTGAVSLKKTPDREEDDELEVTVVAFDAGRPSLESKIKIR